MRSNSLTILLSSFLLAGCASIATQRMAENLSMAMLNQSDPEIVRAGAPAYLLLIDSLIAGAPDNPDLLLSAARLYGAYAVGLVPENERRRGLTAQALNYARRALCAEERELCEVLDLPYRDFTPALGGVDAGGLPALYGYASAWLDWIEARSDDWNALAALPKAEAMLRRVVELQPDFERGRAQLYLGALLSLRPAALGGRPELARQHFERAIRFSEGRDLLAKVEYARRYARLVFDQALHDRLLHEVVQSDPTEPGLTLSNVIAQGQARALLQDDYF